MPDSRPKNYVEFYLNLHFPQIKLKLINGEYEILRIEFNNIRIQFETRPVANNIYFLIKTQEIKMFGSYYETALKDGTYDLVPLVKSRNQNSDDMLIEFSFESNPIEIENVEFSINAKVSSLEIIYEKTSITEMLRFFKTDLIDFEEYSGNLSKKLKENVWSTAGVLFAVDNHKQFHVHAELSSPYFIIPMSGTSKLKQGNSIVFFLGKTIIKSDLQNHHNNSNSLNRSVNLKDFKDLTDKQKRELIEETFYDKLKLEVKDVQVMLVPDSCDLNDYLKNINYDTRYHLLYPVSTENTLFLSINPKYKKLPKLKIDAKCPSVHLHFSDNKIIKLAEFMQKLPLPEMPKTSTTKLNIQPSSVSIGATSNNKFKHQMSVSEENSTTVQTATLNEKDDEWDGPFYAPHDINGDPIPNYTHILVNFKMDDFQIDLKVSDDHLCSLSESNERDYLNLIFNKIELNLAITKYGFHLDSKLGQLKLVDKLHYMNDSQHYTEILSSKTSKELISLKLRQVDSQAPNFMQMYANTLFSVLFTFRSIQLVAHRTGIIYFLKYGKKITDNINFNKSSTSTVNNNELTVPASTDHLVCVFVYLNFDLIIRLHI